MEESTVSIIMDLILLKLWYAVVQIREKNELKNHEDIISPIIKALTDDADAQASNDEKLKELLQDTFSSRIKGILVDAEKEVDNHEVKTWVKNLEDALYEADDLMDMVYNEVLKPVLKSKELVSLGKKLREKIINIIDTAARYHARPEEPHKVFTKEWDPCKHRLNLDSWLHDHKKAIEEQLFKERSTNGEEHVAVVAIVGNGGLGKTTLALNLFQQQMPLCVDKKQTDFELRIWVNVPYDFHSMRSLVEEIIASKDKNSLRENIDDNPENFKTIHQNTNQYETSDESLIEKNIPTTSVTGSNFDDQHMTEINEKLHDLHESELCNELRKAIDGKRLLLVLDSVLHMDCKMWLEFKNLLSHVGDGSRIIVTTRSELVGKITASTDKDIHLLRHLDEYESCKLFEESAFNFEERFNSEIVEIAVEIVKRCGGNPYALKIVGEKLHSIYPETQAWSNFCDEKFQNVVNEEILPSLKLSYYILPRELKHCFAYCAVFPQQFEIDVKNLIHLWMAQGLIYPSRGQRMEDVGYDYVKDLCQRYSLFEEVEVDHENGLVTKCKMPKLIHDLAVLVAGTRLATILKEKDKLDNGTIDERTQHVSFHFHFDRSWRVPSLFQKKKPRVRTIILPSQLQEETEERLSSSTFKDIISTYNKLRTLDLHGTGIKVVPDSIDKLKYLRYLDLSQNKAIKSLPDSITKISYLMTLKLSSCYGLKQLPKDMEKLVHLKHLEIDWCYSLTHMPPRLGKLTQLETLSEFVLKRSIGESRVLTATVPKCLYRKGIDLESLEELAKLNNLRGELKIKNWRNVDVDYSKVANLAGKEHLKSLSLSWELDLDADDQAANDKAQDTLQGLKPNSKLKELGLFGYKGDKLSDWLISLTNLVKFSLQECKCKSLQPLTQLTSLKVLILDNMPYLKYISDKSDDHNSESNPSSSTEFIQKLEELRLTELPNLEGWREEGDASLAFPCLSKLMVEDCPKLRSMLLYPNLKEWLVLKNTSLTTFVETMNVESSSTPLSNLQSLCIIGDKDIGSEYDRIEWKSLKSLQFLRFNNLPELKALPEGLQHVTTLEELDIWGCPIESLPDWLYKFRHLKRLGLSACLYLKSLPDVIENLKIETLEIVDCPFLLQRCQKGTGADWEKIKSIENILLQQQPLDHGGKMYVDDCLTTKMLYGYYRDPRYGKKSTTIKRTVLN